MYLWFRPLNLLISSFCFPVKMVLLMKLFWSMTKNACFFTGKEGPLTQILLNLIIEDMESGPLTVRTPIPY